MFFNDKNSESEFAPLVQQSLIHMDNNYLYEPFSKWLTVGKMIEILNDSEKCFSISPHNNMHIGWTFRYLYDDEYRYNPTELYSSPSWLKRKHTDEENKEYFSYIYCDSLLEAVKVLLD